MIFKQIFVAVAIAIFSTTSLALPHSKAVRAQFQRVHPCPANGHKVGACPGFVVDHKVALCVGGHDSPLNMGWMHKETALLKDKWECKPGWEEKLRLLDLNGGFIEWNPRFGGPAAIYQLSPRPAASAASGQ